MRLREANWQRRFISLVCLAGFAAHPVPVIASTASNLLRDAWSEYQFQTFDIAQDLFYDAFAVAVEKGDRQEARLGLAMTAQFDEAGVDLKEAAAIYQELLDEGLTGRRLALVKSMLAECSAGQDNLEKANQLWGEVIEAFPDSIVAQDALLKRTHANMGAFESPETLKAVHYLEEKRGLFPAPTQERPGLAPAFELLRGEVYFWRGQFKKSRQAYMNYVRIGTKETTSYSQRATAIMKVARISELKLNDAGTAGQYYRMLVEETPNDVRSFYALEQALKYNAITFEELKKLKIYAIDHDVINKLRKSMSD